MLTFSNITTFKEIIMQYKYQMRRELRCTSIISKAFIINTTLVHFPNESDNPKQWEMNGGRGESKYGKITKLSKIKSKKIVSVSKQHWLHYRY